jgi:hypothetical protein
MIGASRYLLLFLLIALFSSRVQGRGCCCFWNFRVLHEKYKPDFGPRIVALEPQNLVFGGVRYNYIYR